MQVNVERHADEAVRDGIGEGDSPGAVGWLSPAAACRETTEAADGVPDRDRRGEQIGGGQSGQAFPPGVPERGGDGGEESAVEDAAGLQCTEREQTAGVFQIDVDVHEDHEGFRADDRRESDVDAEVRQLVGVEAVPLGELTKQVESEQETAGDEHTIGRQ